MIRMTTHSPQTKVAAIAEIIGASGDTPIVFTTGYACRIANDIQDKPGHFYMVGSMGLAGCVAAGVAAGLSQPVIVVDGDGALAMNPGALLLAAEFATLPLIHIVVDDRAYSSTGAQPTPPVGDIESWAASLGYLVLSPPAADGVGSVVAGLLAGELTRPHLLRLPVAPDGQNVPGRIEGSLAGYAARFRTHCRGLRARSELPVV
jgi:thiamine pyrophosphate-dependent acetolactate synthase large subunit-like protein